VAKRRRGTRRNSGISPVASMLFGLAVGLSVAFAVYMKDRRPDEATARPEPASMQDALDDNGEAGGTSGSTSVATEAADAGDDKEQSKEVRRFTFYDILPNFEMVTPDEEPASSTDSAPQAVVEPGVYVLQAGSFSTHADADRRRAELALHGIESHIQRVKVNDRNYHRVYIGPTDDLDELNLLRSRLRAAQIDVLRIRLSD
jgi:cell division protein FtsN